MSEPFSRYEGHSIFRNQPPHSFFNKSFEHPTDALYLGLNDIDSLYLRKDQLHNDRAFESNVLLDPRTKQEVQQVEHDHTCLSKPKIFRSSIKSSLTKGQHVMCLRVLKAWQQREEVQDMDLLVWRRLERKRQMEKQQMAKFIFEYGQTHKERIYAPTKKLVELYKKWYTQRAEMLLQSSPNVSFNTHTGLPHVRVCRSDTEQRMEIGRVQLLERKGWVRIWANATSIDCQQLHRKVETFADYYSKGFSEKEEFMQKEIKKHLDAQVEGEEESHRFHIPLESLLFLLTAGEYPDLSTECLLEIQEGSREDSKLVNFQKPLPSRNCGWHTHKQVVDQAYAAYLTVSERTKWLRIDNDEVVRENTEASNEIEASMREKRAYRPLKFEDYLQKYETVFKPRENELKFNAALVKWQLKPTGDTDHNLDILTTLGLPPALNESASQFLGSHSVKLEYKTQFGCEAMTKYELIKLWLQMRLMHACYASEVGYCYRIAVDSFETHLEEELTLPQLEHQLANVFHLNMPQLLSNLGEFLRLLLNMPVGKYMLRHTPKYKDQFLLCAPSQEITQNTIFLHDLLKVEPSDLLFMTQPHFLPIDDFKCSSVHLYHRVLPCAFLPALNSPLQPFLKTKKHNVPMKTLSDRDFVTKRIQQKVDLEKARARRVRQPGRGSKSRKKRRIEERKAESKQKAEDDEELQRDMAADKLLYGDSWQ